MNKKPCLDSSDDIERITAILNPDSFFDDEVEDFDTPEVSYECLGIYEEFLEKNIELNMELTGRESMGYFSWEERFEFEGKVGDKEYLKVRKEIASCRDIFLFLGITEVDEEYGLIAKVKRKDDNKTFEIPLEDLEAAGKERNQVLDDYATWFVNYR